MHKYPLAPHIDMETADLRKQSLRDWAEEHGELPEWQPSDDRTKLELKILEKKANEAAALIHCRIADTSARSSMVVTPMSSAELSPLYCPDSGSRSPGQPETPTICGTKAAKAEEVIDCVPPKKHIPSFLAAETIYNELGTWQDGKLKAIHPDRKSEFQHRQVRTMIMDHLITVASDDELEQWIEAIKEEIGGRK